jgi:hypothetical protein
MFTEAVAPFNRECITGIKQGIKMKQISLIYFRLIVLVGLTLLTAGCGFEAGPFYDENAPSVPTGLTVTAVSSSQIDLSWTASTDKEGIITLGVGGYKVYRNGDLIIPHGAFTFKSDTQASDAQLTPSTLYCYTIRAYDERKNESAQSSEQCATTLAADA